MFSPSPASADPAPRPPIGLRRGGPVLLREVMPAALERLLSPRPSRDAAQEEAHPRRPPLPHAA